MSLKLSEEFLNKYKNIEPPMTNLGNFVYYRTYSRFLPELNRREYWWETCKRAVEYNCNLVENVPQKEAEELFDSMFNLKMFLSGRTLWVGGTESSKKYPSSNFNCSYTNIEKIDDICEVFYLLMLGCGVGFSALKEQCDKLPIFNCDIDVQHKEYIYFKHHSHEDHTNINIINNEYEIVVGDSKEGWADALRNILRLSTANNIAYSHMNKININYNNVRPEGSPLKTFGGYASGPEPLKQMFEKIVDIIKNSGGKLKPVDVLDICNLLGQAVQVGGVRRSAEVCLFDKDDTNTRLAKQKIFTQDENGNWITDTNLLHRQSSNNSILFTEKPSYDELKQIFESIKTTGEPGFINSEVARKRFPDMMGMNPCCLTGDMTLLTSDGYKRFDELSGKNIEIVNKDGEITIGKVWESGLKNIYAIKTNGVNDIFCTDNHVFMLNDGSKCEAKDLKGKRLMPFLDSKFELDKEYIKYGFLQGDGCLTRLNSEEHLGLEVNIGNNDLDIFPIFNLSKEDNKRSYYINGYNSILRELGFSSKILPERVFPNTYKNWTSKQKLGFLKGCYSANGSILSVGRITYKTTCFQFAEELKEALSEFNISAYITTNKSKSVKFKNGEYLCKESYDINIANYKSKINFNNAIGFAQQYKSDKLRKNLVEKSPKVVNVYDTKKEEMTYDFTEPKTNWGVVNGFVAHNCEILLPSKGFCNLVEVNCMGNSQLELFHIIALATRASYRMACVDIELPEWNKNMKENMLLGVSLSGWQDFVNQENLDIITQKSLLKHLRNCANGEMKKYAYILGRNESKLVTTEKPSGTLSLLPTVSPGVHHSHAPYYIRRVRINAGDPLVKVCENLGYKIVPEVGQTEENCTTKVIEFYIKAPEGKTKQNVTALEQLETYKMFMENYVDHNTSITVTVKSDEWNDVVDWVYNNWDIFIGISFLALDGGVYQLCPYEAISKEQYYELIKNYPTQKITPDMIAKYETTGISDIGESECSNGICPIR